LKKTHLIFFTFILSIFLVGLQFGSCRFNVEIDDNFSYVIGNATLNATLGSNTFQVSGINIENTNIEETGVFYVTVKDILPSAVVFTYRSGEHEVYSNVQNNTIDSIVKSSNLYVFSLFERFANSWSNWESFYQLGYDLLFSPTFVPFIDIGQSTWDFIEGYAVSFNNHFSTITSTEAGDYYMDYKGVTRDGVFLAEWFVEMNEMRTFNENEINVTGISQYRLAIQQSTGVILGSRYEGSCSGEYNGEIVDFFASICIEDVQYNMPSFELSQNSSISPIFIISSAVSIFVGTVITAKRRK